MIRTIAIFLLTAFYSCDLTAAMGRTLTSQYCSIIAQVNMGKDSDGDGVPDDQDECPGTGPGIEVDERGCPKDSDDDGLINTVDRCPFLAGDISAEGCPDRDGDGVEDMHDECPDVFGLSSLRGCPDRDGDGIADHKDSCPDLAGSLLASGCPDKDNDGVRDDIDQCPFLKGAAGNNGCPLKLPPGKILEDDENQLLQEALYRVKFAIGKKTPTMRSFEILDRIAELLIIKPDYNLFIIAHTDNTGSDGLNLKLSEERARSVLLYLREKGIDQLRLTAAGKGASEPIYSNNSSDGRSKNRRIEFLIY